MVALASRLSLKQAAAGDNRLVDSENRVVRSQMTVTRYASAADADRDDAAFWAQIPVEARVLEVWRLSRELWRLSGTDPDESGLCRSIARLHRR